MNIQYNKAFTVVELMLTVAIMAVIVGMASPTFFQMVRKNQLNRVATGFVENLNKTRSAAIFYKRTQSYDLTSASAWQPTRGVVWDQSQQPRGDIAFDMLGRAVFNTNFECYILQNRTDSNIRKIIVIHRSGTINFENNATSCPTNFTGGG